MSIIIISTLDIDVGWLWQNVFWHACQSCHVYIYQSILYLFELVTSAAAVAGGGGEV